MKNSWSLELVQFLERHRGRRIVFTNGCFDILHRGHAMYLQEARAQGDCLIIGLNSDASVKRLKGDSRPVNREEDRKYLLEALACVDFVEIFDEETPLELIQFIRPTVLVKGGDWKVDQIVGSSFVLEYGGSVKSLAFLDGYSTSATIHTLEKSK